MIRDNLFFGFELIKIAAGIAAELTLNDPYLPAAMV
jgi:hypothetical protein|tara:strand:- start:145 stop:252 length:108 start_codon:yes stop_codon:yes gene_type:complete